MFSTLFFIRLALITMSSFSVAVRHFYDRLGFPPTVPDSVGEPITVNMLSFSKSDHVNNEPGIATCKKRFGRKGTSKVSVEPRIPPMNAPYSSFYRNSRIFEKNPSHTGNGIPELAWKVSELINTLNEDTVLQTEWLNSNLELVKDCQELAENALLQPKRLSELERLWAIGIWVALQTGRGGNTEEKTKFLEGCNKQVYLEIQATSYYRPTITKAFDHWVNELQLPMKAHGSGLEEYLKRAALIGEYESERGVQFLPASKPIGKLVQTYLTTPGLPQEGERFSKLLGEFGEVFKNTEYGSSEGQYAIAVFQHILQFWSNPGSLFALSMALQDEKLWKNLHISRAKYDLISYSEQLKQFLHNDKLNSESKDIYSILNDSLKPNTKLNDVIQSMSMQLKSASDPCTVYRFLMAHDFLEQSLEGQLISKPSWNIVDGLQRVWSSMYPGFKLGNVDVMEYQDHLLLKYPHLLAYAKLNDLLDKTQSVSTKLPESFKFIWQKPFEPYDVSYYGEEYYQKIGQMMDLGEEWVLYPLGLEMLMNLTNYLPNGPEFLLKMLQDHLFGARVHQAMDFVIKYNHYTWLYGKQQNIELMHFVKSLSSLNQDEWIAQWPKRTLAEIRIGRCVFSVHPTSSVEDSWAPFSSLVLEDIS
ncbi:hypothetical protein DFH28DRAFT_903222 [Melampsora americana]|nr:hypothetical protein DFH28DRAFT_903222 [Melampsora americana]